MKIHAHEVPSDHRDDRQVQAVAHRETVLDLAAAREIDSENREVEVEAAEMAAEKKAEKEAKTEKEADRFHHQNIENSVILEIVRNLIDLGA